ncbi:MAG: flavodoxin domain-containing protein, partial [Peptoniphilus harei]|nr:flavodoxin domain-containing protein [Peptoniphilus harei]
MSKVNVIYWSGTGNTEKMANAIVKGAEGEGAEVKLIQVGQATEDDVKDVERIAFGCPAMGSEELEETELRGKPSRNGAQPQCSAAGSR